MKNDQNKLVVFFIKGSKFLANLCYKSVHAQVYKIINLRIPIISILENLDKTQVEDSFIRALNYMKLLVIIMIHPTTMDMLERIFFMMRIIKNYLKNTIDDERFRYLSVLRYYKELLDIVNLVNVTNDFIGYSRHRLRTFRKFTDDNIVFT